MGNETFTPQNNGAEQVPEPIVYDEFGSLPDHFLLPQFGITSEEGRQILKMGEYEGTFAQMLYGKQGDSGPCPLKNMIATAHSERGVAGTQEVVAGIKMMSPENNHIQVADKTDTQYALVGAEDPKKKV